MKSDVIEVSSREDRTGLVLELAERTAVYQKLSHKSALHLRLLAEEMMSMMRAIVGDVKGRFWIESEDGQYELHLRAETDVDWLERERLLSASSSGRNEAERGFMGKLRAFFGPAEGLPVLFDLCPDGIYSDMTWSMRSYEEQIRRFRRQKRAGAAEAWDELDKSVAAKVADDIKVSIRSGAVEMVMLKKLV